MQTASKLLIFTSGKIYEDTFYKVRIFYAICSGNDSRLVSRTKMFRISIDESGRTRLLFTF